MSGGDYSRQEKLVPTVIIKDAHIAVIGVGAVGRNVALGLAKMGARHVRLVDPQEVGLENVSNQGYVFQDVGETKVASTVWEMIRVHPDENSGDYNFDPIVGPWMESQDHLDFTFVCVDSIEVRKEIFRSWKTWVLGNEEVWPRYLYDTRMFGETMRILAVSDTPESIAEYEGTLFAQDEAFGGACVVPGSYPYSQITAGLALHQFVRSLRDEETCPQLVVDLKNDEMYPAMARQTN